jgi:ribosomal protein L40E
MLDGNAIAGTLAEIFGDEMTLAVVVCAGCGARGPLAEPAVYMGGPGVVVRCRRCDAVLVVVIERRGTYCVDLPGSLELRAAPVTRDDR